MPSALPTPSVAAFDVLLPQAQCTRCVCAHCIAPCPVECIERARERRAKPPSPR